MELNKLAGGAPAENAAALASLLDGTPSAYRDIVLLNSAAALTVAGGVSNIEDGLILAADAIDSGKAKTVLTRLAEFSHG